MEWFSENRFQRIVLNDQTPEWLPINVGVLQQSNLGPLFLIFINGQSADILSTFNLFADDILFSVAYDPEISEYELNQGLKKIYGSVFSGKCHLSQILTMRFRKLYFQENLQNHLTFRSVSTMHLLLVLISRSM